MERIRPRYWQAWGSVLCSVASSILCFSASFCLGEVRDDVLRVLDPHTQPDHFRRGAGLPLLRLAQLPVHHARGMRDQGPGVPEVGLRFQEAILH